MLSATRKTQLEELKQHCEQNHKVQVLTIYQDLARENAAQEIYDYCQAQNIELDILVNNAGMLLLWGNG